jgi:hypothetical protein
MRARLDLPPHDEMGLFRRNHRQWRSEKHMRLVQRQVGRLLADHTARSDRGARVGGDEAKRAFEATMGMQKIDVAAIEAARRG